MEIKKIIIIFIFSFLLSNRLTKYEVTLYGVPMANITMSFNDSMYNNIQATSLYFQTVTNDMVSQFFKVDNEYHTIIKNDDLDILFFKKLTYQPNIINKIKTLEQNDSVIYEGTNIVIPENHFNIFSLLYYLSMTEFNEIKSEVNLEREGLIYKCIIDKKINKKLYEFELKFNLIENNNLVPVFKNSDIFTWGLFREGSHNKVIINPLSNQIEQCEFSVGFSSLEAKIKRPLSN